MAVRLSLAPAPLALLPASVCAPEPRPGMVGMTKPGAGARTSFRKGRR